MIPTFRLVISVVVLDEPRSIVREGVNTLSLALSREGPAGLQPTELQIGETTYLESERRYMCPAQVRFAAWLTAVAGEDGSFLDFEVKGEQNV